MGLKIKTVLGLTVLVNVISVIYSCKAGTPDGGINPTSQVQSSKGANNSLLSETFHNSIKTVATINISGHLGGLILFCVVFVLLIGVYKKLSEYLGIVNDRLHNFMRLFGIQGFTGRHPAIESDK